MKNCYDLNAFKIFLLLMLGVNPINAVSSSESAAYDQIVIFKSEESGSDKINTYSDARVITITPSQVHIVRENHPPKGELISRDRMIKIILLKGNGNKTDENEKGILLTNGELIEGEVETFINGEWTIKLSGVEGTMNLKGGQIRSVTFAADTAPQPSTPRTPSEPQIHQVTLRVNAPSSGTGTAGRGKRETELYVMNKLGLGKPAAQYKVKNINSVWWELQDRVRTVFREEAERLSQATGTQCIPQIYKDGQQQEFDNNRVTQMFIGTEGDCKDGEPIVSGYSNNNMCVETTGPIICK